MDEQDREQDNRVTPVIDMAPLLEEWRKSEQGCWSGDEADAATYAELHASGDWP